MLKNKILHDKKWKVEKSTEKQESEKLDQLRFLLSLQFVDSQ